MREWGHGPGASRGTDVVVVLVDGRKKIRFSLVTVLVLTLAGACSSKRSGPALENATNSKIVSSTPPFQTREPVSYRAIRSVTFAPASGGETIVTRNAIAKDGELRREEETFGSRRLVYLDLPTGRFLLLPEERIYASINDESVTVETPNAETDGPGELYMHTGPIESTYENVAREDLNGRMTTKYRVAVNNSDARTVSSSETLIWVDETLGMPIKSVTTSSGGIRTMELSEVSLEIDKGVFRIPPDYQKVDVRFLRLRLR